MTDGIICLDTETTGLSEKDEILQLAIINGSNEVLFYDHFRPQYVKSWPKAQSIHGISPAMVENKRSIEFHRQRIQNIIQNSKIIIGYNLVKFDLRFLKRAGISVPEIPVYDVMLEFADIYGEWHSYYENNKWQKLVTCAKYYGYPNLDNLHDSLEDVKATLYCYRCMNNKK